MESMSFTYQHSSTSVSIATKPSSSRMLLDSDTDSDSEEEPLSCSHSPTEVDSTGDIPENCLVLFLLCTFLCFKTNAINTLFKQETQHIKSGSKHAAAAVNIAINDMKTFAWANDWPVFSKCYRCLLSFIKAPFL